MIKIELFREGITLPYKGVTRQKLIKIATAAAQLLDLKNASITIIATDDAYMRDINRKYRRHDEPTDVISFSNRDNPFPEIDADKEEIGDLYISIERADRQAREYRVSIDDEVKRLIVHGILHLVGYDHERSDSDEEIMLRKEDELCGSIDV
ncbi:MAG TPA: rRNA maturation RNase YbeY [Spirochaetota bacterium]|nr:rRNA maturation RNase YbeY [Spirochaetota bacterium]HPG51145.1 rRNA maturation RNase YbeY [Spirochaetota bacterium]HPN11599.1 rRNA maturation RNase YbeY [Spirochaetota bacterium]HQL83287.1 rRNA maturation RNase YbeY [Spirochaetota bacterium]